jgi:4-cresol dehydrogenase (hydroxylating) flavoprotein subunit
MLQLPPNTTPQAFERALTAFAGVVGKQWVLASEEDRREYRDVYAFGEGWDHGPSATVAPASVEEVQALVRHANEYRIPLWPISRGKNFGYGGSAPVLPGTVVLDLGRMRRILEVDADLGYCILEPGVGFFELYDHLQKHAIPLWMAIPGNAWGSVVGNALERGFSQAPYGDHTACICGMEVVLPDGELVRTGMGAMNNSPNWPLFKYGFGPSWDQVFAQSALGVVTKMGFWLMPEPEATLTLSAQTAEADDIGWIIDVLRPLRLKDVFDHKVGVRCYMGAATTSSQRNEWYEGPGAIPESVVRRIMAKYGVGWWNFDLQLHGDPDVNQARARIIRKAFEGHGTLRLTESRWQRGEPHGARGGAPVPSVFPLQIVNWHGGRGGHIGFSPVMPANGRQVLEQFHRTRARHDEFGVDYSGTFYLDGRCVTNINLMLYDRDDAHMTDQVRRLFDALVTDAAAAGYGEYRTHLSYMDQVARTFDFNGHALLRLNERIKDALDPHGILAPGKQGVWPKVYRSTGHGTAALRATRKPEGEV